MSSTTYGVIGMTCGHCTSAVSEEIGRLDGVRQVDVNLVTGGISLVHVTSDRVLDTSQVGAAVDEAGYRLVRAAS